MCAYSHSADDGKNAKEALLELPDFLLDDFEDDIIDEYRKCLQSNEFSLQKDLF